MIFENLAVSHQHSVISQNGLRPSADRTAKMGNKAKIDGD